MSFSRLTSRSVDAIPTFITCTIGHSAAACAGARCAWVTACAAMPSDSSVIYALASANDLVASAVMQ